MSTVTPSPPCQVPRSTSPCQVPRSTSPSTRETRQDPWVEDVPSDGSGSTGSFHRVRGPSRNKVHTDVGDLFVSASESPIYIGPFTLSTHPSTKPPSFYVGPTSPWEGTQWRRPRPLGRNGNLPGPGPKCTSPWYEMSNISRLQPPPLHVCPT